MQFRYKLNPEEGCQTYRDHCSGCPYWGSVTGCNATIDEQRDNCPALGDA